MNMNSYIYGDFELYRFNIWLHNSNMFFQTKVLYESVIVFVYVSTHEGWGKGSTLNVFLSESPFYFSGRVFHFTRKFVDPVRAVGK